jgi:hypothetical protein
MSNNYFIKDPIGNKYGEQTKIFIVFSGGEIYSKRIYKFRDLRFWIINKLLHSMKIKIEVRYEIIAPTPYRQEKIEAEFAKAKEHRLQENQEIVKKSDADYEQSLLDEAEKKDNKLKEQHE